MLYIADNGDVICDHLCPKKMFDTMRLLCRGKNAPLTELYKVFNVETKDGKDMHKYSELLGEAITSIIDVKAKASLTDSFLVNRSVLWRTK